MTSLPFQATRTDFLVSNIPNLPSNILSTMPAHFAGVIPTSDTQNYYFQYFPSPTSQDMILHINSGIACTPRFSSFTHMGPFSVQLNGSLTTNPDSWTSLAHTVFIEAPSGAGGATFRDCVPSKDTGFDAAALADSFFEFLNRFESVFDTMSGLNLYVSGGGYDGVVVPYIARKLMQSKTLRNGRALKLKGIALGNPLLDAGAQVVGGSSALLDAEFLKSSGFFGQDSDALNQAQELAVACKKSSDMKCGGAVQEFALKWFTESHTQFGEGNTCVDSFQMDRVYPCNDNSQTLFEDIKARVNKVVGDEETRRALHLDSFITESSGAAECSSFRPPDATVKGSRLLLNGIVKAGVRVVMYAGSRDFQLHTVGVERVLSQTLWGLSTGFIPGSARNWTVNSELAGTIFEDRGLTLIRVAGAGHMVGVDKARASISILQKLLTGQVQDSFKAAGLATVNSASATVQATATAAAMKFQIDQLGGTDLSLVAATAGAVLVVAVSLWSTGTAGRQREREARYGEMRLGSGRAKSKSNRSNKERKKAVRVLAKNPHESVSIGFAGKLLEYGLSWVRSPPPLVEAKKEIIEDPVSELVVAVIRRVASAAPRILCVVPPTPQLGTHAVRSAFCFDDTLTDEAGCVTPVRYLDLSDSALSLDVRIWAAEMERDSGGLQHAAHVLFGLFAGIATAILGDWADPVASNMPKSRLPPLDDEVSILNTFYRVLETATDQLPIGSIVVVDGVDSLSQLASTGLGQKAMAIFFNHLAALAKGPRSIGVCMVTSGGFVHDYLLPLAARELVALVPFGDMSKELAKEHYLERLREVYGVYKKRSDIPSYASAGTQWGHDASFLLATAEENFDAVHAIFGGRAMDLVGSADHMVFTSRCTCLEDDLRAANDSKARRARFIQALRSFNDIAASTRWLEMHLDPSTLTGITDISNSLENKAEPLWMYNEAVSLFQLLVNGGGAGTFDDAVGCVRECGTERSESESVLVVRSLILHRVLAYRPASSLYVDGLGSAVHDTVTVLRPLHLYAFKLLMKQDLQ
ncbi:Cell death protease [Chytriomyces hyalinus]|nr:Cell death protease [Chytriomyces hyalinus]